MRPAILPAPDCCKNSKLSVPHSSVGVAVGYWLDGRGSIPGWAKICPFSITSSPALVPTQPPTEWLRGAPSRG
jgi:hypothetical protein